MIGNVLKVSNEFRTISLPPPPLLRIARGKYDHEAGLPAGRSKTFK